MLLPVLNAASTLLRRERGSALESNHWTNALRATNGLGHSNFRGRQPSRAVPKGGVGEAPCKRQDTCRQARRCVLWAHKSGEQPHPSTLAGSLPTPPLSVSRLICACDLFTAYSFPSISTVLDTLKTFTPWTVLCIVSTQRSNTARGELLCSGRPGYAIP